MKPIVKCLFMILVPLLLAGSTAVAADHRYVGVEKCGKLCHKLQ